MIGGAADGAAYVSRLLRAIAAGRLEAGRVVVVDRDPGCAAGRIADPRVELQLGDWPEWLDRNLGGLGPGDHLVPYHWAPHLLVGWLQREAVRAGARTARPGAIGPRGLPFERNTRDGDRALSYASWPCPPSCIEPALCPHTRGARDWSLAGDLLEARDGEADAALVLPALHLVWGVATIPVGAIHEARRRILEGLRRGPMRWQVATASHCHGLATLLSVSPGL